MNAKMLAEKEAGRQDAPQAFVNYDSKIPSAIAHSNVIDYGSVEEEEAGEKGGQDDQDETGL